MVLLLEEHFNESDKIKSNYSTLDRVGNIVDFLPFSMENINHTF